MNQNRNVLNGVKKIKLESYFFLILRRIGHINFNKMKSYFLLGDIIYAAGCGIIDIYMNKGNLKGLKNWKSGRKCGK